MSGDVSGEEQDFEEAPYYFYMPAEDVTVTGIFTSKDDDDDKDNIYCTVTFDAQDGEFPDGESEAEQIKALLWTSQALSVPVYDAAADEKYK